MGGKTECLKRGFLYNKGNEGGIDLVNVEIKIKAFSIMHVCKFLFGDYCKWKDLALYWLKLDVRDYLSSFLVSNNMPYSLIKPKFYTNALLNFKSFVAKFPDIELKSLTVKKIYILLLRDIIIPPRIVNVYPNVNFSKAFFNCNNKLLSSEGRDVSFRILHHVLPVNDYLFSLHIIKSQLCTFCKIYPESLIHLFFECSLVKSLWPFISGLLSAVASSNVIITSSNVIFNVFQ